MFGRTRGRLDHDQLRLNEEMARTLAKGYASGIRDVTLPGDDHGIAKWDDVRDFADSYAWETVKRGGEMPKLSAHFVDWRKRRGFLEGA